MKDHSVAILSDITTFMKYAKYIPEINRRETWQELCERNMAMHIRKFPQLRAEIQRVYKEFVLTKKVLPSMRSLQFGGRPIELAPSRIYNCAYAPVESPEVFSEAMFLLLGGTGFGFSVQSHHVTQLPRMAGPSGDTRRFVVGDSIEGWADAVKVLIESYFHGKRRPVFDFSDIRPKGAALITSGGKAPGPDPLVRCLEKLAEVMDRAMSERGHYTRLTTLECHDMLCHIADAVLAGGIRRAAMISLFDRDDHAMLTCKSGNWWEENPQRGRANNSATLPRGEVSEAEFKAIWQLVEDSGAGEPGVYWTNNTDWGTNPCCVSGDTRLLTREGVVRIGDVVGETVDIWNGENWREVSPFVTGTNDKLYRVQFSDGSFLDTTSNHRFIVEDTQKARGTEVLETSELIVRLNARTPSGKGIRLPRANITHDSGSHQPLAYEYGFFLGDGHLDTAGNPTVSLYGKKRFITLTGRRVEKVYSNQNGTKYEMVYLDTVDRPLAESLKDEHLPESIFGWDRGSILSFIAGWADADGSQAGKGIRIYGKEQQVRDAQLLLTKAGLDSSVNLMSSKGDETNFGARKHAIWYLQITSTAEIPCRRLLCNNTDGAKFKGKYQVIRSITEIPGEHTSYCLNESELGQCVFNNVLTKQCEIGLRPYEFCNLTEINADDCYTQDELNARARAGAFIGTLQAGYTDFHYLRPIWRETTERDALIGVGLTGIGSGAILNLNLTDAAEHAVCENVRVAEIIGINPAARTSTIKPAGTSSLVLGSASGVHAWHNDYYIRRIRVGKNEAIYRYLAEQHPELVEDEFFRPNEQAVISVPQKAPAGAILRHESPEDLLERVRKFNVEWVRAGHVDGDNTHNVSCTISVKDDEWEKVGQWMWDNRDLYNGISVLPYNGGTYQQAPFEDISEAEYNRLIGTLSDVDLTRIIELGDDTDLSGEIACGAGGCEVK